MNTTVNIISLLIAIAASFACYKIAQSKGRGPVLWAILGFFFSLITLVVIALLPRKN